MKLLVVAHPDDEIIWFNPEYFDQILIAFNARHDRADFAGARSKVISEHPLRDKILFANIPESGFWENKSRYSYHMDSFNRLNQLFSQELAEQSISEVFTHNCYGEYGHADHRLIYDIVKNHFFYHRNIPVWTPLLDIKEIKSCYHTTTFRTLNSNKKLFHEIKKVYDKYDVWTYFENYEPPEIFEYFQIY